VLGNGRRAWLWIADTAAAMNANAATGSAVTLG
jgi:hypothetical protein